MKSTIRYERIKEDENGKKIKERDEKKGDHDGG